MDRRLSKSSRDKRVSELIRELGLTSCADRQIGGMGIDGQKVIWILRFFYKGVCEGIWKGVGSVKLKKYKIIKKRLRVERQIICLTF